jgi:TonB family protein
MSFPYPPGETTGDKIYSMNEVTVKARILSRAEPFYTETARAKGTRGRIVLKLVLGVDGKVRIYKVVKSLPDGLTVEAIRAAHRIKFIPALKDGQPVSQLVQVEYGFNIY